MTIRNKHRRSNRWRTSRIPGREFMRRFLQHVLPKGLHKVRYFGLWHHSRREQAARVRLLFQLEPPAPERSAGTVRTATDPAANRSGPETGHLCPSCRRGSLVHIRHVSPKQPCGP